jgi:predicted small lipoprotein YifL
MQGFFDRPFLRLALAGALGLTLALAGCGRKGGLDPPPASLTDQHAAGNSATGAKPASGQPPAPAVSNKRIPLDALLN